MKTQKIQKGDLVKHKDKFGRGKVLETYIGNQRRGDLMATVDWYGENRIFFCDNLQGVKNEKTRKN